MNREQDHIIALGAATQETKGGPVGKDDHERGFILAEGLSDD